jgi:hypothetical protein
MRIIKEAIATTKNNGNFNIQIEDWSKDYPDTFMPDSLLVAYLKAKVSLGTYFGPRKGHIFRCEFHMPDGTRAREAFDKLIAGNAELDDYFEYIERRKYIPCITGRRDD